MNRKIFLFSIAGLVTFSLSSAVWAEPQINPGNWEITTQTEMAGMPPQSVTHVQCITNDDLVPMSEDANQECQVTNIETRGNTVSWEISCGGQGGGMSGTGEVTYEKNSMHGVMRMTIAPYGTQVKNTISGKRIGDCDGSDSSIDVDSAPPSRPGKKSGDTGKSVIEDDVKDVGRAAHDEAKQATVDEVREGVRNVFKGLFD